MAVSTAWWMFLKANIRGRLWRLSLLRDSQIANTLFKRTCYAFSTFFALIVIILYIFGVHNNNCSTDLYNKRSSNYNYSSHKTDWILSESRWMLCLAFYITAKQYNECTWRIMFLPLRNLHKCIQVACSVVVVCLFLNLFFILMLLYSSLSLFLHWCCLIVNRSL